MSQRLNPAPDDCTRRSLWTWLRPTWPPMIEQHDPAHAGVTAGRVVGMLTAALLVARLLALGETTVESVDAVVHAVGADPNSMGTAYLSLSVAGAAFARYAVGYVGGSLIGVAYGWLGVSSVAGLVGLVATVGVADAVLVGLGAQSTAAGAAQFLAWLVYVPVFCWAFDADDDGDGPDRRGPRRLGET